MGAQWLGIEWRGNSVGYSSGLEAKIINPDMILGMFAFDILICNRDRHANNILFQRPNPNVDRVDCILIDHTHALIGDLADFSTFSNWHNSHPDPLSYIQKPPPQLRAMIGSLDDFDPWILRIQQMDRSVLEESIQTMPGEWLPSTDDADQLIDFLVNRRHQMKQLIRNSKQAFPSLP